MISRRSAALAQLALQRMIDAESRTNGGARVLSADTLTALRELGEVAANRQKVGDPADPVEDFVSTKVAAGLLGVSVRTVVRWCHSGRLDAHRPGGRDFVVRWNGGTK